MKKLCLAIIFMCLCQRAFADFNTGDTFGKGIVIQNNGTTLTGGGRTLNFSGGVTASGGKYNISNGGGSVTTGVPGQAAIYTSTTQIGSSDVLSDTGVNVGIGTTAPATKLEVDGDVYIKGLPSKLHWVDANGACWVEIVNTLGNNQIDSETCLPLPNPINNNLTYLGNNLTYLGSQLTY